MKDPTMIFCMRRNGTKTTSTGMTEKSFHSSRGTTRYCTRYSTLPMTRVVGRASLGLAYAISLSMLMKVSVVSSCLFGEEAAL